MSHSPSLEQYDVRCGRGLAAIICIKEYKPYGQNKNNLPNTIVDRQGLQQLFEDHYGFKTLCLKQNRITLQDFQDFLYGVRHELYTNHQQYDAFILAFSGHGHQDTILLSDLKEYGRVDLYRYFNGLQCPKFKRKPKLLLIDACKGEEEAPLLKMGWMREMTKAAPSVGVQYPVHPDDNIVIFDSNSDGYVSYDFAKGGALMQSFIKVMRANSNKLLLDDMAKMIERDIKRIGRKSGTMQMLDCKLKGIDKRIYFCAPK